MLDATYEKLLKLFINAQRPGCADAVCKVLKKKTTGIIIDKRMERDWKRSTLGKNRRVAFSLT